MLFPGNERSDYRVGRLRTKEKKNLKGRPENEARISKEQWNRQNERRASNASDKDSG
jgi:hypothetical protein